MEERDKEIENLNKSLRDIKDKMKKSSVCLRGIPERFIGGMVGNNF